MLELNSKVRSTTVLAVRRNGKLALAGDGQITQGSEILKTKARKVRSLYRGKILAGFAGSTADALTLFSRFEDKLEEHQGNLERSAVELARDWRTDKKLRHLEALLLVADVENTLLVSGNGDVIEPDDNVAAVGSGGPFATAAAVALLNHTDMSAFDVAMESMKIAAHICIYTNAEITLKELG